MKLKKKSAYLFVFLYFIPFLLSAQNIKVLTNHIGYEISKAKHAVILADGKESIPAFQVTDALSGKVVYSGKTQLNGPVAKWKNWIFWTADFSSVVANGNYVIKVNSNGKTTSSYPFVIGKNVLESSTLSNVIYYFKGQRSSGLSDKADRHLLLKGQTKDTIDVHGGWYDASGDYGKHLSHLTFSTYFNPQQITLTTWSLLKTYEKLVQRKGNDFRQYNRRLLDEAMYGADYLVRVQANNGVFLSFGVSSGAGQNGQGQSNSGRRTKL